jgi:hypothetical protein
MTYIIKAYSVSTNTTQREIALESKAPDTAKLAQMTADSFAQRLCERTHVKDWVGQIELVDPNNSVRTA